MDDWCESERYFETSDALIWGDSCKIWNISTHISSYGYYNVFNIKTFTIALLTLVHQTPNTLQSFLYKELTKDAP